MKDTPAPVVMPVKDKLPPVNARVIVVGKGARCLGYMDQEGIWRDDARKQEIHDVTGWFYFEG